MRIRATLLALLLTISVAAEAAVWTDLWWNPNESGWGVNINHQYNVIFMTFFVYSADGKAHWYVAAAAPGATLTSGYSRWDGDLYETTGPYLGSVFNPNAVTARKAGTVSFLPATPYTASLTYSVDGVVVTKSIERQTLQHIPLSGNYTGGYSVKTSTCPAIAPVGTYGIVQFSITATVSATDGATGTLTAAVSTDSSAPCLLVGSFRQYGSLYFIPDAAICSSGIGNFTFTDFSSSDDGIDGNFIVQGPSCRVGFGFSAVRQ